MQSRIQTSRLTPHWKSLALDLTYCCKVGRERPPPIPYLAWARVQSSQFLGVLFLRSKILYCVCHKCAGSLLECETHIALQQIEHQAFRMARAELWRHSTFFATCTVTIHLPSCSGIDSSVHCARRSAYQPEWWCAWSPHMQIRLRGRLCKASDPKNTISQIQNQHVNWIHARHTDALLVCFGMFQLRILQAKVASQAVLRIFTCSFLQTFVHLHLRRGMG
jgi:hypothetical protein